MILSVSYHLFFTICNALTIELPKSTLRHGLDPQGWTPRPTPAPEYKLVGREESVQSLIWAEDNTCGYLSGVQNSSYTCGGGRCAYLLSSGKAWGNIECCSIAQCTGSNSFFLCVNCDFPNLACVDSVNYYTYDNCDAACQLDSYTLKCTETSEPFCNTLVYPDVTVTDIRCGGSDISSPLSVSTIFNGETERTFYTETFASTNGGLPAAIPTQDHSGSDIAFTTLTSNDFESGTITVSVQPPFTGMTSFPLVNSTGAPVHNTPTTSLLPSSSTISNTNRTLTKDFSFGPILGGTLGGVVFIALLTGLICSRRKRKPREPKNQSPNPEISELEVHRPHTTTQPIFHELHEEEAPTFAWYKLWKPSFSHQSRYSDAIPDSPTLGRYAKNDLFGFLSNTTSPRSAQPISSLSRQELPADEQVSPQQVRDSEHITLDQTTVSPLSPCSEVMGVEPRARVTSQGALHQDRIQSPDLIRRVSSTEGFPFQNQESPHEFQ